jgi:4-hydroxy-2-oxoglutarate aldolase
MRNKICGVIAPISTPFVNEEVNLSYLRENVHKYAKTPLAGFFVLGSNGENKSLSEQEKLQILRTVVKEKLENQIVIAGIASESTHLTITFAKQAANLGADYVSLLPPSYFRKHLNDESQIQYYLEVAENSPIPVMAYNAPGFNGITLSLDVIKEIAEHPNIVGMKDTSLGQIFNYLEVCNDYDFHVLSGTINTFMPALLLGASGGVVSLANAFPKACFELYQAITDHLFDAASNINSKLLRMNRAISGSFGVAGVKYAMDIAGYYGGDPRRPLLPLKDREKARIRDAVSVAGIILEN